MRKLYFFLFLISFAIILTVYNYYTPYSTTPISDSPESSYQFKIILIPLDSRPACTTFVAELAKIADINVVLPPKEIMDNYKTTADKHALRQWLYKESKDANAAIISIDMLVHGGLLASRQSVGTQSDIDTVIHLLTSIHQERPQLPIYAFSIIPRLLIADNTLTIQHQKNMMDYSVLKDQIYTFENPVDIKKLEELEQQIPAEIINNYTMLYQQNMLQNMELIKLVDKNVITNLVIGQDDGQPFGLPNIIKQRLYHYISLSDKLPDKVVLTRGTDEVALTILGKIAAHLKHYQPKIFVTYSDENAPYTVMPYMPHSVATTVNEKIKLVDGVQVNTAEQANFILFIHVGTQKNQNSVLPSAVTKIQTLLNQGYQVALVDLSQDFTSQETVFPLLLRNNIELTKLIAYAGWNTTSNSIGTAITQATVFTATLPDKKTDPAIFNLYKTNLEFLTARFLDDWYYLKEVQPALNKILKFVNIDPYHLGSYYEQTDAVVRRIMQYKSRQLLYSKAFKNPLTVTTQQGAVSLAVTSLDIQTHLPWERTFEIYLRPSLTLSLVGSDQQH
ncbi:hypothetical protein SPFL3102_01195 [Sporomusaceae bacterium FL31]|nr:hypothetical protein SPFL3101_00196 [Sporomusaceae bacterium FL31]GCE33388.1 hypothetical protein SPFL3102_01195 [Sporomusaceae bacterium]